MVRRLLPLMLLVLPACGPAVAPLPYRPVQPATVRQASVSGIRAAMVVMAERQFVRQDKNRDGWIDRFKEWEGWDDHFILGDTNRDNKLTRQEYEDLMTSPLSVDTFQSIAYRALRDADQDRNGKIDGREWQAQYKTFSDGVRLADLPWQSFDRNRDGALNSDEYEDAFAHHWSRHD